MSLSVVDVVRACVQTQRTPIDIARERGAFRMLKRLHGAVNQQGQAKHLFKDEAMWVLLLLLPGLQGSARYCTVFPCVSRGRV